MARHVLLLALLLASFPVSSAFGSPSGSLGSTGPYGGFARLLNQPAGSDTFFLATMGGGLYRSTDRAHTWARVPSSLAGYSVTALAGDPNDGGTVFVATPNTPHALIRTTDGGETWQGLAPGRPARYATWGLAVDPGTPGRVYFAGGGAPPAAVLFRSDDDGDTWSALPVDSLDSWGGTMTSDWIIALLVSPTDPLRLYLAWTNNVVLRSDDGGLTWTRLEAELPEDLMTRSLQFDGASDAEVVLVGQQGVFKTWDAGTHWTRLDAPLPVTPTFEDRFAYATDPADTATRYVSLAFHGTYVTHDACATWTLLCDSLHTKTPGIWYFGSAPREILASDAARAVVRSTDELASFQEANAGVTACMVKALAWNASGDRLYAGTGMCGGYVSPDGGVSWGPLAVPTFGPKGIVSLAASHADPLRVFAGVSSDTLVYRSDDGGITWTGHGVAPDAFSMSDLQVHPDSEGTVWGGALSGLYVSRDAGVTWTGGRTVYPMNGIRAVRFEPEDHRIVYLATGSGLWRSSNNDSGWTRIPIPGLQAVAIHPSRPEVLLVGIASSPYHPGVWRSEDAGATWSLAGLDSIPVLSIEFDPADTAMVYAGTAWRGLWRSTDGGRTWSPTELDSEYVNAIAFRPGAGPAPARAATPAGRSLAETPSLPATLYLATQTAGVLHVVAPAAAAPPPGVPPSGALRLGVRREGAGSRILLWAPRRVPEVTLRVYDVTGRRIRELYRGPLEAGQRGFAWSWDTDRGGTAASGLYFVRASAGGQSAVGRALVLH